MSGRQNQRVAPSAAPRAATAPSGAPLSSPLSATHTRTSRRRYSALRRTACGSRVWMSSTRALGPEYPSPIPFSARMAWQMRLRPTVAPSPRRRQRALASTTAMWCRPRGFPMWSRCLRICLRASPRRQKSTGSTSTPPAARLSPSAIRRAGPFPPTHASPLPMPSAKLTSLGRFARCRSTSTSSRSGGARTSFGSGSLSSRRWASGQVRREYRQEALRCSRTCAS